MQRLEVLDAGIIYVNPDPAYRHVFASHPHPVQLSADEFVCTYECWAALYTVDSAIAVLRSHDGGVTWNEEGSLHYPAHDDHPYSYHDGIPTLMRDGALVVLAFRVDRTDQDRPLFGPSGGLVEVEPILFVSNDGGRTWSEPLAVRLPPGMVATPASAIVELADGAWLATFDVWHRFDDPTPYRPRMVAVRSEDGGRTWGGPVNVATSSADGKGFWHGKTIRRADGSLYTMLWAADLTDPERGPVNLPIHVALADPAARSWSVPEATTIPGQTNCPAELPDGRLAAVYTAREGDRPGIRALLSVDGDRTWDVEGQVQLWDASGWTHIGFSVPDKYPHSHDTIAFGAPTLLTTLDGDLYASWWCTHASLTHLRWARLRVVD